MKRVIVVGMLVAACGTTSGTVTPADGGTDVEAPPPPPPVQPPPVDAGCGDTQASAKNCGVCGHDCGGGTCEAGVCKEFTLTTTTAAWIDVDDTAAYFLPADFGDVMKVPLAGGAPVKIGTGLYGLQMAMSEKSIVGLRSGTDIASFAKDGSNVDSPKTYTVQIEPNASIAANGKWIVQTNPGPGALLYVIDETTGAMTSYDNGYFFWWSIVGATGVVSISNDNPTQVVPFALPPPATGTKLPAAAALGFQSIHCAAVGTNMVCAGNGGLQKMPLATPTAAPSTILTPADVAMGQMSGLRKKIAGDDANVYWVDATTNGVFVCAATGCTAPRVLSPDAGDALVAASAKAIVWSDSKTGTLHALIK